VLPAVIAGSGLAMLNLVCVYAVAIRNRPWMLVLCAGIVLQAVAISLFHDSPTEIAWAQACVGLIALLANEVGFHSLVPRFTTQR
jgi:hypothetical protein